MAKTGPVGVAVIGAGNISKQYLDNLTTFPDVKVLVVADLFEEAAAARAAEYGIEISGGVDVALNHPDVEIVVNLTIPAAHVEVATAAVKAGKHVWTEKPFSLDRDSGLGLLKEAQAAGMRLGCAPDTFLGAGLQTARRLIDAGAIGTPLTALTMFQSPGPESWHPNPAFLFQEGAGPLFDMAPYYLTALVQTFGPIAKVAAVGSTAFPTRTIGSGPKAGEVFDVEVPTHVSAMAQFESGASSHSVFSFESPKARMGFVEITGTEGTISLPDPNNFDGDIQLCKRGEDEWTAIPAEGPASGRGMGVLDMARAIRAGVPHRVPGELAYHVLDAMVSIAESVDSGEFVAVKAPPQLPGRCPRTGTPPKQPSRNPDMTSPQIPGSRPLGVAAIGYAFMGQAHSNAWRTVANHFDVPDFEQKVLVGRDADAVAAAAHKYGWSESATDWREVIARDDIDIVDICAPGWLHAEIATAALAAGKHVLVEKPLANSMAESEAMVAAAQAARAAGVRSMVGFNYRRVPGPGPGPQAHRRRRAGHRPPGPRVVPAGLAG